MVVRYDRIAEALIPMGALGALLQLPALHTIGAISHPVVLLIPSAAPTTLIRGAFEPLAAWEWAYGLGVTAVALGVLGVWARRAFVTHIVERAG